MTSIQEISLDVICLRKDARQVVKERVNQLVESMKAIGPRVPIIVRPIDGNQDGKPSKKMEIIAGVHRYEAHRALNLTTISAIICNDDDLHAELIQIDENLCRAELSPAQVAAAIARRKELYEALHPKTVHGGDRKSSRQNVDLKGKAATKRFSKATAEAIGKPERHIQRAARRGEKIGAAALQQIAGTSLDKPSELDALAALDAQKREELVTRAAKGEKITARQQSGHSQVSSEEWRSKFSALKAKAPSNADREWAFDSMINQGLDGTSQMLTGYVGRDPKRAVRLIIELVGMQPFIDAVIDLIGASTLIEAALPHLNPEMQFELGERLSRAAA